MPSIPGIPKNYYEHRAKSDHSVKSAREGAYQKECSHCRDLVQFHQQSECFLVVATVLLVHKEFVFLQGETKQHFSSDTTRDYFSLVCYEILYKERWAPSGISIGVFIKCMTLV